MRVITPALMFTRLPIEAIEAQEIEKLVRELGRYSDDRVALVCDMVRQVLASGGDEELYGDLLRMAAPLLEVRNANP